MEKFSFQGKKKFSRSCATTALLLLASYTRVPAQVTTGAISGYVVGPDSRPIPRAGLVISDANGFRRQAASDSTGLYRFPGLPPALYKITASAEGFEGREIKDLN